MSNYKLLSLFIISVLCQLATWASDPVTFEYDGATYRIVSATDFTVTLHKGGDSPRIILPETVIYNSRELTVIGVDDGALDNAVRANRNVWLQVTPKCEFIGSPSNSNAHLHIIISSLTDYLGMSHSASCHKSLYYADGNPLPDDIVLEGTAVFSCMNAFSNISSLKSFTWDTDDHASIPSNAFYNCRDMSFVSLPAGCNIGSYAFGNCQNMDKVEISGKGSIRIEAGTFRNCHSLEIIDGSIDGNIDYESFNGCCSLKSLSFNSGQHIIYSQQHLDLWDHKYEKYTGAFYDCTSLTRIDVPDWETLAAISYGLGDDKQSGTDIYKYDFFTQNSIFEASGGGEIYIDGKRLEEIRFPEWMYHINPGLFYKVNSLRNIDWCNLESIGHDAFNACSLEEMNVIDRLDCGDHALGAKHVILGSSTENHRHAIAPSVKSLTIYECECIPECLGLTNLEQVVIHTLRCSIPSKAFKECKSLSTFDVKSSYNNLSIEPLAFDNTGLKHIKIPSGVTEIKAKAFFGPSLESVELSPINYTRLICNAPVDNYRGGSFYHCNNLSTLLIDGEIYFSYYYDYSYYPWMHSNIRNLSFGDNMMVANIDFFVTGTEYGSSSNDMESTLERLTFGANVNKIIMKGYKTISNGNYLWSCHYDNTKIIDIKIKNPVPPIVEGAGFSDWSFVNAKLSVPKEAIEAYRNDAYWGQFWNIAEYESDNTHTGIVEKATISDNVEETFNIYTLQGIIVKRAAKKYDIESLTPGIYICGGKKIIVR